MEIVFHTSKQENQLFISGEKGNTGEEQKVSFQARLYTWKQLRASYYYARFQRGIQCYTRDDVKGAIAYVVSTMETQLITHSLRYSA